MSVQTYIAFGFALYCVHVTTSVMGIYFLERVSFASGEISFNLKKDIIRMAICSMIALLPTLFIFYHFRTVRVVLIYSLLFFFSVMVAYLGISIKEILVIAASNIFGIIAFQIILLAAGLWAVYLLLLAGLVPLISNAAKKKKIKKEQTLADIKNEGTVRNMAARDPGFQTYCYECKNFNHDLDYCQRKRERQPVKDIRIKDKTLCAAWEAKR